MTDNKNSLKELEDNESLIRDLQLDMDEPIGSAFATALRDDSSEKPSEGLSDSEFDSTMSTDDLVNQLLGDLGEEELPPGPSVIPEIEPVAEVETSSVEVDATYPGEPAPEPVPMPEVETSLEAPLEVPLEVPVEPPVEAVAAVAASALAPSESASLEASDLDIPMIEGGDRILPRITMHAFCRQRPLQSVLQQISDDRRMQNVIMEIYEGGIPAAINHYANETTPNLLVLEAGPDGEGVLQELDALAEHCDENIRVVVIGDKNDIRLYRQLMDRGVSEYLVTPLNPVQLIRAVSNLFSDPETPFTGKTLAVTGVKGGVGASAIAHNLAWALTERIKVNSTLVDLDLNFGTTGLDFNQEPTATIADALMSPDRFDDAVMGRLITQATERLSLFTAPASLDRTYDLDPETYVQVLDQVRGTVPFVVLDLPHIWSDWFKSTILASDEVVVVATPDLASLRNGKNLVDFLLAARPNDAPPRLVVNMTGLPKRPEIPAKDFGQAIGIDPALVLPFDAQLFGTAANNGQMIFDVAPDSKCAQGIDELASLLTGRDLQTAKGSLLKKILGR